MLTLAQEINHVLTTPRLLDSSGPDGKPVYAPFDITAPGFTFRAVEYADVVDELFALAVKKDFFNRPTFTACAVDPASPREQFDDLMQCALLKHPERRVLLPPSCRAVWEEWFGDTKRLSIVLVRDPAHSAIMRPVLAIGSGLYDNVVPRLRLYWDLGVREIRFCMPEGHQLLEKTTSHPVRNFSKDSLRGGNRLLIDRLTKRP